MEKRLITINELSDMLSIKVKTLYKMTRWGKIPVVKIGRLIRYDIKDIDRLIQKNRLHQEAV